MSDRSVSVHLRAEVASFVAGMKQAQMATKDLAAAAEKSATDHKQSWEKVGKGSLITGGVIAAGIGLAVKAFMDFDKEMSGVKAVSNASAADMDKLSKAAMKAGADTVFSASEAAKAEGELAKAGVSTADILGGALTGSLNLASAGGLDLANAATISAQAMNIFKLKGQDVAHIADVLASGANKSAADVAGLGDALKQGGLVAAQTGLHLEDTVGILSMFADSALVGSDAGTSLKTMLMRLVPSSVEAKNAMNSIGFSAYDAGGKFVGMESVAQQLKTGLGGLSEQQRAAALNTIFGSDATRAASILYEKGAVGVRDYTTAVNDNGAAARMAATQLDNLSGDLEALKGSVDTALIQTGSSANGVLRDMAQKTTGVINAFGALPAPIQGGIVKVAALGAVVLVTGGALVMLVPKVVAAKTAISDMGIMSGRTGTAIRGLGVAATVATIGLPLLQAGMDGINSAMGRTAPGSKAAAAALLDFSTSGKATGANADLINVQFGDLGTTVDNVFSDSASHKVSAFFHDAAKSQPFGGGSSTTNAIEFFKTLDVGLTELTSSGKGDQAAAMFKRVTDEATKQGYTLAQVQDVLPGYTAALDAATVAAKGSGTAAAGAGNKASAAAAESAKLADAETAMAKAADEAKKQHDALKDSITGYASAMMAARGDARSYQAAIDAASASLKENGRTLDITTEKGRNNQAALDAIATSALKAAESTLTSAEANGTLAKNSAVVAGEVGKAREEFIKAAMAMGTKTRPEAEKLATAAGLTAGRVKGITDKLQELGRQAPKPTVGANITPAQAKINEIQAQINAIRQGKVPGLSANSKAGQDVIRDLQARIDALTSKTVTITVLQQMRIDQGPQGMLRKAGGGLITGAGTGTSDSIAARVSNGEYVVRASSVAQPGVRAKLDQINSYAGGGFVASGSVPAPAWGTQSGARSAPVVNVATKVYVQNPFTGQYLLAQVSSVVDGHTQQLVDGMVYGGGT